MKKLIIIFFLFFLGCHYNPNSRINKRTPPVVVVAIDTSYTSVVLRDGDNKVFTIYNNSTTNAISESLKKGDTVRLKNGKIKKVIIGDF